PRFDSSLYHSYGIRVTETHTGTVGACYYLDRELRGCKSFRSAVEDRERKYVMLSISSTACFFFGFQCTNIAIITLFDCDGSVCVSLGAPLTESQAESYELYMTVSGVSGAPELNRTWRVQPMGLWSGSAAVWKLVGSTFVAGA